MVILNPWKSSYVLFPAMHTAACFNYLPTLSGLITDIYSTFPTLGDLVAQWVEHWVGIQKSHPTMAPSSH